MEDRFLDILSASPTSVEPIVLGSSRAGREIHAFRFGRGERQLSLIGGCHADEPVGPRFLRLLVSYLASLPSEDKFLRDYTWHLIPHLNPDGEAVNSSWYDNTEDYYDLERYCGNVVRELPGDDIEFGFPRDDNDIEARPENRAAFEWWRSSKSPFHFHASLHGMGFAQGPWFLIEPEWVERSGAIQQQCSEKVNELGYRLHDMQRNGEKGFSRIAAGFCTRPNSVAMRDFFLERKDLLTAAKFRPSSMETMRELGEDCLTLVSEMPLFILPKDVVVADRKKVDIERPMSIKDQMQLQWVFISSGIACRFAKV